MPAANYPTRREIHIALGITAALLFAVVIHTAVVDGGRRSDFVGYYTVGLILRQGNASRLYDPELQSQIQHQMFNRQQLLINPHPPFEALWFAALAKMSFLKAYLLWGAVNLMLWLLFQHLMRPHAPVPNNPFRYLALCSLFAPLWIDLILGQTTLALLLLFSLTYLSLKRGQEFRAGLLLGLGLFKFPLVLPFAFICFLRSKWRMMSGFAAAAAFLAVLSILVVGPAGMRSYFHLMIDIVRNPDNPVYESMRVWAKMPTIKGFCATLLDAHVGGAAITLLSAGVSLPLLAFVAWCWRQADRLREQSALPLIFSAAMVVSQVTAPHLYAYDLTLMLLPVLLVVGAPQWQRKSWQRVVLIAILVILYCPFVYAFLLETLRVYLLAPVLIAFALAAISLAKPVPAEALPAAEV